MLVLTTSLPTLSHTDQTLTWLALRASFSSVIPLLSLGRTSGGRLLISIWVRTGSILTALIFQLLFNDLRCTKSGTLWDSAINRCQAATAEVRWPRIGYEFGVWIK